MAVTDETNFIVEVINNNTKVVEHDATESVIEVLNHQVESNDVQTTTHIIEVVRKFVEPFDVGETVSVDVVNTGGGTLDSESIAAIVRLVYVANERPVISGTSFFTDEAYKPLSTRVFINGLRQTMGSSYNEDGGNKCTLSFDLDDDDVLLVDYIKL